MIEVSESHGYCGGLDMKRIWMLRAAGILCIIAGVPIVVIAGIVVALGVDALIRPSPDAGYVVSIFIFVGAPWSILSIIVGTFAIVGGIYALRRRRWGLALAGSICVLILGIALGGIGALFYGFVLFSSSLVVWPFVVFGILGLLALLPLVFVIKGKGEFR
jgi:hypothetical protein